jgi:hypothetical protein
MAMILDKKRVGACGGMTDHARRAAREIGV